MGVLYGLAVCGGQSSRMGIDKSMLVYHDKPQGYYVHDMLDGFCKKVFISCNSQQAVTLKGYNILTDDRRFENIGPMAALLTAFKHYPENDFLVIGCDYPLLTASAIDSFLQSLDKQQIAAAFYNKSNRYEPLIAWYKSECATLLMAGFDRGEFSLQHFLQTHNATKYPPENQEMLRSVDIYEDFLEVQKQIRSSNLAIR